MTLSRWLRDYLYIPLGGNRGGRWRTYRNLMLTMLIGGLWHGASWTFVVWGGIHGVGLAIERCRATAASASACPSPQPTPRAGWSSSGSITFNVVCLAWVFFRCAHLRDARSHASSGCSPPGAAVAARDPAAPPHDRRDAGQPVRARARDARVQAPFSTFPLVAQGLTLAGCFFLIDALGPIGVAPFIYFQF